MGKKTTHRLSSAVIALGRVLGVRERAAAMRALRALLGWQRTLRDFPRIAKAPDATPYVSLYANGKLRGCFGTQEGTPGERVARAFLLAQADTRYGRIAPTERATLAAEVAYITRARPYRADQAREVIEPGTNGVAIVRGGEATVLLPSVARDRGYDAAGMLDLVAKKAGTEISDEGVVWVLDVDAVSSHGVHARDRLRAARTFLESLVERNGRVAFEVIAGTGEHRDEGTMRLARIAVAIAALDAMGSERARPARAWLAREIARGVPERPDMRLGTFALASMARVDVPLAELARSIDPRACSPWHAAQAAAALGKETPDALWNACVRDLDARPFAPYTLMAARARGDAPVVERCVRGIVDAIRPNGPHTGGATITKTPETALTAVAVEALSGFRAPVARRARGFIEAQQILDVPASLHPSVLGAFRASPIAPIFRCDITAHAVLALFN